MQANTIDEVIQFLNVIIKDTEKAQSRLGYFAALYIMVTEKVRDEVHKGKGKSIFDDPVRMEKLDVIFANRYLAAYTAWQQNRKPSESWRVAFEATDNPKPIVLQHLMVGMNAHINLDLGIAAAEVCKKLGQPMADLQKDFDSINTLLAGLVGKVEHELSSIWRPFKWILKLVPSGIPKALADVGMSFARKEAWEFAGEAFNASSTELPNIIQKRDNSVAKIGKDIVQPPWLVRIFLGFIRKGEHATVAANIRFLNGQIRKKIGRS